MSGKDECLDIGLCLDLTGFTCKLGVNGEDYKLLKELLELDYNHITPGLKKNLWSYLKNTHV
jgi:hypothetical protein